MKNNFVIEFIEPIVDVTNDNADVIVRLKNGRKYVASFYTPKKINELLLKFEKNSTEDEYNNGSYFWVSDMCIIKSLDIDTIRATINHIIKQDNLENIFSDITNG